ncbi:hypothetical protein HH800_05200 [Sphingobium yanoikuyae]|uniref:Uncharacterized protein n=1 Tax=Sphingobium yanoikuyae TaxID=13690 RepID=A0A6M4G318_SPHYA|nr:hypothetical protein [Sphingobium yanoikuyae]QJR01645.1 hypothetical protein HH800_05200 [Sphingobium yanoikuyae]
MTFNKICIVEIIGAAAGCSLDGDRCPPLLPLLKAHIIPRDKPKAAIVEARG